MLKSFKISVEDIQFLNDEFSVETKNNNTYKSKIVIGAYGKRSSIRYQFRAEISLKTSHLIWL